MLKLPSFCSESTHVIIIKPVKSELLVRMDGEC